MENAISKLKTNTNILMTTQSLGDNSIMSLRAIAKQSRLLRLLRAKALAMTGSKAQVFIETTLFFVAAIFLLLMIIRVWVWSNNQMAGRQPAYNDSRVEAGTVAPPDRAAPLIWVVENEARGDRRVYTPTRLTRDWVFRGEE